MAQHDYLIDNGSGAVVRSDLNNVLDAVATNNSGTTEPAVTHSFQWWADTTSDLLKQRNEANNGWIVRGSLSSEIIPNFESTGIDDNATSTAITIDASDNVGIGTSSPSAKLGVNSAAPDFTFLQSDTVKFRMGVSNVTNGGVTGTAAGDYFARTSGGKMMFSTNDGVTAHATIDNLGNVGIGTISPAENLHISASTDTRIALENTSNRRYDLVSGDSGEFRIWDTAVGERLRISAAGNLLVGKTVAGIANAGCHFSTGGNSMVRSSGTVLDMNRQGTDGNMIAFYNDASLAGTISVAGSATSYNTSSDYRLKELDVPMTGATERVKALRPINFAWKADGSRVDGFFAHELAEVVPEAATGTIDAMRDEEYEVTPAVLDTEGLETTPAVMGTRSVPDYQGIDQSKLVPLLTAAMQELIARIEALEE